MQDVQRSRFLTSPDDVWRGRTGLAQTSIPSIYLCKASVVLSSVQGVRRDCPIEGKEELPRYPGPPARMLAHSFFVQGVYTVPHFWFSALFPARAPPLALHLPAEPAVLRLASRFALGMDLSRRLVPEHIMVTMAPWAWASSLDMAIPCSEHPPVPQNPGKATNSSPL